MRYFLNGVWLLLLAHSPLAAAAEPAKLDAANTAWMLTATGLVLFMTLPGLALFYAGMAALVAGLGGVGYPDNGTMGGQVGVQLAGVLATAAWSGVVTYLLLKVSDALIGMRVGAEDESEGLDTALHNEKGYNL